jgi:hypothetical protein
MNKLIICILSTVILTNSACKKNKCEEDVISKLEIVVAKKSTKQFPGLADNTFVIGNIAGVSASLNNSYEISNEVIEVNGQLFNGSNLEVFKVGTNLIETRVSCKKLSNGNASYSCPCTNMQEYAKKEITVLDTARVWVKSIHYWKTFGSPRPDIYLVINNWGKKSNISRNYSRDKSGDKIWDINDTFTICKDYFNLSITAWDDDRIGNDEHVQNYNIPQVEFQNWAQDTLTYYKNGGIKFVIQRL